MVIPSKLVLSWGGKACAGIISPHASRGAPVGYPVIGITSSISSRPTIVPSHRTGGPDISVRITIAGERRDFSCLHRLRFPLKNHFRKVSCEDGSVCPMRMHPHSLWVSAFETPYSTLESSLYGHHNQTVRDPTHTIHCYVMLHCYNCIPKKVPFGYCVLSLKKKRCHGETVFTISSATV